MSIYQSLPLALRQGEQAAIVLALCFTYDNMLEAYTDYWRNYYRNIVDPAMVDEAILDNLAVMPISPWRTLWDTSWKTETKRLLLRDSSYVFQRRLFPDILSLLFSHFELTAKVKYTSGWVLNVSLIPARLGANLFDYVISIPPTYTEGTQEFEQVRWICENFGSPKKFTYVIE